MSKINLLFTCDRNYIMPTVVAMTSIFENDKDSEFLVYILHSGIGEFEKEKLKELENKYKCKVVDIKVDEKYFKDLFFGRWSKELWYRLLIKEYIPKDLGRIFNLDSDIIVTDKLGKFYNIDFEDKYIIAPYFDDANTTENKKRIMISQDLTYFHPMSIFNLNKIDEILNYDNVIKNIKKHENKLAFPEMDLLNILFSDKVRIIPKDFYYVGDDRYGRINKMPSIIHYSSSKPWDNFIRGKYDEIWLYYLKISPYSELYYKKYNNFKTRFLRNSIVRFFIRNIFFNSKLFIFMDKILPRSLHKILKKFYRKYIK